jgi:hypothetical protein
MAAALPMLPRWTTGRGWNGWRQFEGSLCYPAWGETREYFWIRLGDLEDERAVLNMLRWVKQSPWVTDAALVGLTRALCDVWSSPPVGDDLTPIREMKKNWGPEPVDFWSTG